MDGPSEVVLGPGETQVHSLVQGGPDGLVWGLRGANRMLLVCHSSKYGAPVGKPC
jgi:hypothetical protein